jgi:protein-L-isoaspartate(D-aspartate) O-methyltransferase
MLEAIRLSYRYSFDKGIHRFPSEAVLDAMAQVPREEFVPPDVRSFAYDNQALPIDYHQTISQPFIVALMTELVDPQPGHIILEIGAGSGYQAAVLSLLVKMVFTLEIISPMAEEARRRLNRLGFNNIEVFERDGHLGLDEHAPFDGIIVTAATPRVPPALIRQLKPGGKLVIPLGQPLYYQELTLIQKNREGDLNWDNILGVAFVPLTRKLDS